MKKDIILLIIGILIASVNSIAQCEKDISSYPLNPINNEFLPLKNDWYPNSTTTPNPTPYTINSFLNTSMNWSPGTVISLDLNAGWEHNFGNASNYNMRNPFANNHQSNHLNSGGAPTDENDRDWRWEDGWELLWMNTGKYPNGDAYDNPSTGTYYATGNAIDNPLDPEILDAIAPSNVPYFVLYNRYRGTLRLFANVWQNNLSSSFQEWAVTLKYLDFDQVNQNVSGLFRHASPYDLPLDQPSESFQQIGPRVQAINSSDWIVAEFQMAFDPCICLRQYDGLKTPGKIEFLFETIETVDIDLLSRTIETENAITEANLNDEFLNLSKIDPDDYTPGSATYKRMDDMLTKYQNKLDSYNDDMDDFNEGWNNAKWALLDVGKNLITSGVNLAIPAGSVFDNVLKAEGIFDGADSGNKITNNAVKGLVGAGVDYAAFEVFGKKPTKPVKPSAPMASFAETSYKGDLTRLFYQRTTPLLIPGGITNYEDNGSLFGYGKTQLYPSNFPAYNKVMGISALLRMPEFQIFFDSDHEFEEVANNEDELNQLPPSGNNPPYTCIIEKEIRGHTRLKLKATDIEIALNRSLDFDYSKTNSYVRIEATLVNEVPEIEDWNYSGSKFFLTEYNSNNFHLEHNFPLENGGLMREFASKWIPISKLNQYVYSLDITDIARWVFETPLADGVCYNPNYQPFTHSKIRNSVARIEIKILQDNYFDQVGYLGEPVNTTQVTTVVLFDAEDQINFLDNPQSWNLEVPGTFDAYTSGILYLGDENFSPTHPEVTEVVGNDLFVRAEEIFIDGDLTVTPPYKLNLEALNKIQLSNSSSYEPNTTMRIRRDFYNSPILDYIDNSDVASFCNNSSSYQANNVASSLMVDIKDRMNELATPLSIQEKSKGFIEVFPNPANDVFYIRSTGNDISAITLFDLTGRVLKQRNIQFSSNEVEIDLSGVAPGTYIIKADCNNQVFTEKLIVTK